ncbi:MAG: heptaprenylglyceryl phosphate synthase [Candidatus Aenigmatarchaeota archaeon]|nr:MAG: heptaprenylglyceryl phosphate synthase [Candidatus Aenigmarchaeota archaeon]
MRWKHITKIDPDRPIDQKMVDAIANSGTDAIMVSGTQGITREKILRILGMLKDHDIPKILEPSSPEVVFFEGFDYVYAPSVMNTKKFEWILGYHKEWVKHFPIEWEKVVPEAYIILNGSSAVGRVTGALTEIGKDDVVAYAKVAEMYFGFPVVYIEYSGRFGDPEVVGGVKDSLRRAKLFYGGGIKNEEQARIMSKCADTIVVGNVIYELGLEAFLSTVRGAKE